MQNSECGMRNENPVIGDCEFWIMDRGLQVWSDQFGVENDAFGSERETL